MDVPERGNPETTKTQGEGLPSLMCSGRRDRPRFVQRCEIFTPRFSCLCEIGTRACPVRVDAYPMFTIQSMPNLSVSIPNIAPHGAFASGIFTVPPADSFSK